ncbi:MAG: ABC transporter permease [Fusobacteriaceae bacterium]|nr:ABC transporter permease [Fusobacteriaceae bacterium]
MGAIHVMWKRQLIRFTRARARIVISLVQPLLFLIAFGYGFGGVYAAAGEGDYMSFLAPGIVAMTILFGSVMNGAETIWDKQFGFLKETLVAPVPRWKIMLGRTLGGATVAIFQGILVLLITMLLGFRFVSWYYFLVALLVMFLIAMFFNALGIAIASRFDDMSAFPMIMNLLIMPMFFLSGALFSLDGLPTFLRIITTLNPMVYGVDALRGLLTGVYLTGFIVDMVVLIPLSVLMIILGAWSFSKIEV